VEWALKKKARVPAKKSFMEALRSEPGYDPPKRRLVFKERPRSQEKLRPRKST
jgi:hypothetical protein